MWIKKKKSQMQAIGKLIYYAVLFFFLQHLSLMSLCSFLTSHKL